MISIEKAFRGVMRHDRASARAGAAAWASTRASARAGGLWRRATVVGAVVLAVAIGGTGVADDWPAFRGGARAGVSAEQGLPESFDPSTGANVRWKAPLPGRGPSSPIIVGNRVFVTAASGPKQAALHVICFDASSGRELWHRRFWATGHTVVDSFGGVAAPTPAGDGESVVAFYSSNDLVCLDRKGNLKWFRGLAYDCPQTRNDVGMASSPLIVGQTVIVQCENQGDSFAAGIDLRTGEDRWRIERDRSALWSSPTLLPGAEGETPLVLLVGRGRLSAVDPADGKTVWTYDAACHTIASPVVAADRVFLPAIGIHALRADRSKTEAVRLWYEANLRSDNPSPLWHEGRLYVIKPPGILVCADAEKGNLLWQKRLTGPFWASPVAVDGRLWCVNHAGLVQIVSLGDDPKIDNVSLGEEGVLASPAVGGGAIYFRTDRHLWKIAR